MVYNQAAEFALHIKNNLKSGFKSQQMIERATHTVGLNMQFAGECFRFDEGLADVFLGVPIRHFALDAFVQMLGATRGIQTAKATVPKQGRCVDQMVLIAPNQRYILETPINPEPIMDFLYFKPSWLQELATEFCDAPVSFVNIQTDLMCVDRVLQTTAAAYLHCLKQPHFSELMQDRLLHVLGICLLQRKSIGLPKKRLRVNPLPQRSFELVVAYIDAMLAQPVRLADLAAVAKLSEHHFLRSFKFATGMTPHQFVMAKRVETAEVLLRKSNLSIAQIAAETGFASQSHLTQTFTLRRGVTPFHYRQH
jgi:AraC-like DNA-binding protein